MSRRLIVTFALALASVGCADKLAADRHERAAEHVKQAEAALEKHDLARATWAAQAALEADPFDPAMRELPLRIRLTALARWPEQVTVERPGELDYQAEMLLGHDRVHASALLVARAQLAMLRGDLPAAEKLVAEARKAQAKNDVTPLVALGRLGLRKNDLAAAEQALNEALQAGADDPGVTVLLADVLLRESKAAEAEKRLSETAAKKPDDAALQRTLGIVQFGLRKIAESGEHLQRAVALDPANPDSQRALADFWLATGQLDRAELSYANAAKLGAEPAATFGRARVAAQRKDDARAAQLFAAAATTQGGPLEAAFEAGMAFHRAGNKENAAQWLSRYVQAAAQSPAETARVAEATKTLQAMVSAPKR